MTLFPLFDGDTKSYDGCSKLVVIGRLTIRTIAGRGVKAAEAPAIRVRKRVNCGKEEKVSERSQGGYSIHEKATTSAFPHDS